MRMLALCVVAACGSGGAGPDGMPHADAVPGAEVGEITVLDGGGLGHMWRAPVVFGGFPTAPPVWHTEVLAAGACRVLAYEPAFCDPPCDGVCVAPGQCVAWPTYRSAGAITLAGLAAPLAVDPTFDDSYLTSGGLPDPLFAPGATVTMTAAGDEIEGFTISAAAPERIAIAAFDGAGQATLTDGADLTVTWSGADVASRVGVIVHSGGAAHGTPPATVLACDAADAGTLTIPRAAIEALPPLGVGCAKGRDCARFGIVRYRRALTETSAGSVALVVAAGVNYPVVH